MDRANTENNVGAQVKLAVNLKKCNVLAPYLIVRMSTQLGLTQSKNLEKPN